MASWDGELALHDTKHRGIKHSIASDAQKLAVSPDGRTLVGGSTAGKIQRYDFETLQLLYDITLPGDSVAALAFTSDNLRFLDLRGSQANVWEPSVLVRKDYDDRSSEPSDTVVPGALESSFKPYDDMAIITALVTFRDGTSAISGRNNGVVDIHDLLSPEKPAQELYKHKGSFAEVLFLAYLDSERLLLSVDNSSRFRVVQLVPNGGTQQWTFGSQLLEAQLESEDPVSQALFSLDGTKLLLSTSRDDMVWSLNTGTITASIHHVEARGSWKWYTDKRRPKEIFLAHDFSLQSHAWTTLAQLSDRVQLSDWCDGGDILADPESEFLILKQVRESTNFHLLAPQNSFIPVSTAQIFFLHMSPKVFSQSTPQILKPTPCFPFQRTKELPETDILIGILRNDYDVTSLIFLSVSGWICSVELDASSHEPQGSFQRHFFVPLAWLSTSAKIIVRVTERRDIIFARGEEVAVVRNGLENVEVVGMGEDGNS